MHCRDVIYNLFPRNGFHFDGSGTFVRVEKRKQSAPDESVASSSVSSSIATPLSNPEMAQTHVMLPDEHIAPPANTFAYTPPDPSLPHTQEEQHRLDELFQQHQWPTLPNKQDLLYVADNTHTQAQRPLFDFDLYDGSPEWGTVGMAGGKRIFMTLREYILISSRNHLRVRRQRTALPNRAPACCH